MILHDWNAEKNAPQERLKPPPDNSFVASMPTLLPLAISLVARSRTSAGLLVKMRSRVGSVLAHTPKQTVLGLGFGFGVTLLLVIFFGGQMTAIVVLKQLQEICFG